MVPPIKGSVMTEIEFNRLLDSVSAAMKPDYDEPPALYAVLAKAAPPPANDNGLEWPFLPFPEGWCASC